MVATKLCRKILQMLRQFLIASKVSYASQNYRREAGFLVIGGLDILNLKVLQLLHHPSIVCMGFLERLTPKILFRGHENLGQEKLVPLDNPSETKNNHQEGKSQPDAHKKVPGPKFTLILIIHTITPFFPSVALKLATSLKKYLQKIYFLKDGAKKEHL